MLGGAAATENPLRGKTRFPCFRCNAHTWAGKACREVSPHVECFVVSYASLLIVPLCGYKNDRCSPMCCDDAITTRGKSGDRRLAILIFSVGPFYDAFYCCSKFFSRSYVLGRCCLFPGIGFRTCTKCKVCVPNLLRSSSPPRVKVSRALIIFVSIRTCIAKYVRHVCDGKSYSKPLKLQIFLLTSSSSAAAPVRQDGGREKRPTGCVGTN